MIQHAVYDSPFGAYTVGYREHELVSLQFGAAASSCPSPISNAAASQLDEYFAGKRRTFSLPMSLCGTEFQMKVWRAIADIPFGEVRTYGEIARVVGNPRAARAVGGAVHQNPLWILIPCHRVVAQNGLGGYAGRPEVKRALLKIEGILY
ncbi:MAG: methylated-DNA--[protein]-cysteine S-methyltransferase [Ruminococcaceae bacterium]|nr:methylated-DNA--[protein]-cysteine S-methyltransferase [Oscillospiraceae bacterium]